MSSPSGLAWIVKCMIGSVDVTPLVERFEWKSIVNNGFIARAKVKDPYFQLLNSVIEDGPAQYLQSGRSFRSDQKSLLVTFQIMWDNGIVSKQRIAMISNMHATGSAGFAGSFEFIAIDPVSYFVNSGTCSGKSYRGKIGGEHGVIKQVLEEYIPKTIGAYSTKILVDDTDDKENIYWMMRQDPKTFIASLTDWSSSFTKHKTMWVIANGEEENSSNPAGTVKIEVKESYVPDLKYPSLVEGDKDPYVLAYGGVGHVVSDISKWELLTDNFMSAVNLKLITSGLSAISGEYWDKIVDSSEDIVYVGDENTENKVNPTFTSKEGFAKPKQGDRGWTHIVSVPEVYSAGDVGTKYKEYIDGRARQKYIEMLNMVMRLRITVRGQPRLYDSTELGRTKVTLRWLKPGSDGGTESRFMDGDWLIYGWHHKLNGMGWVTDLYLARLDYNAKALPGNKQ